MLSIDAWLDEKPYKELFDGVVHEKVSPQFDHAEVSGQIWALLREWSGGRGRVGVELRVYLAEGTTLVPDVAFISNTRLSTLTEGERQKPPFAPDIAVEVRSPEDREANIKRKTELYLSRGAKIVLNVDPSDRTVRLSDMQGEVTLHAGATIQHDGFPDLQIPVLEIFAPLDHN